MCIRDRIITEYLTNYMCFIVLSVEIFSILFTFGVVRSVVVLLFVEDVYKRQITDKKELQIRDAMGDILKQLPLDLSKKEDVYKRQQLHAMKYQQHKNNFFDMFSIRSP